MMVSKKAYKIILFLFLFVLVPTCIYSDNCPQYSTIESDLVDKSVKKSKKDPKLSYYLYIDDFIQSFIEIPTSNVSGDSTTISSSYLD